MIKQISKRMVISLLLSTIFLAIGCLIAFPLSKKLFISYDDTLFAEGIIAIVIAVFLSISGNGLGPDLRGLGNTNAQYISSRSMEVIETERASKGYFKNFKGKSVLKLTFSGLTLIFGGILLIISSALGI